METYYEKYQENLSTKAIDNIDLNLLSIASMNEYVLATKEKPIIGTYALSTCIGIIIYDESGNYSLGHILNNYEETIRGMLKAMKNNNVINIILIPGIYTPIKKVYELVEHLKSRDNYFYYDFKIEIKNLSSYNNEKIESIEFAFDTRTKEFIKPNYDEVFMKRG